ncbi:ligand-binding sensor domain-containing protein [Psychroserpens sp.]|uniref:ligand-binding sensor domain-containing protein n=1 Tax=Psychroserpens sp. TaxID=2020870 RepID=UPI003C75395E
MNIKSAYNILLFFFGMILSLSAQNRQLRAFTLEDGLPQSQVYAMTQDAKGYLWLGTQGGGLARFDGNTFDVYNDRNGLPSNYINALTSIGNTIYIGAKNGLSIKNKSKFSFIKTPEIIAFAQIDETVFILTVDGAFRVVDNVSVEKIEIHPDIDSVQVNDLIYFNEVYWLASQNGLWRFEGVLANPGKIMRLSRGDFKALVGFNSKIFASTFNDGTLVFKPNNFNENILIREPLRINSSTIINENELWIATDNSGVSVIDTETNSELFTLDVSNGLSVPNVRQVLRDRQQNIWMATSGGGLYKYFQNNFKHFNTETGLNGNRIYAVHTVNNTVWISNSEAGLMRIDNFGIHDVDIPQAFSEVKIKTITSDKAGNIWAGSDGRGLLFRGKITTDSIVTDSLQKSKRIIPKTVEVTKVLNTESGFPFDWIRAVHVDHHDIYAATYSSGIVKFRYDAKQDSVAVVKIFDTDDGIQDLYIKTMASDSNGKLWYATQNGHLGYLDNDTIVHLGTVLNQDIPINNILFKENKLFLGTAGEGIWWSSAPDFNNFKSLKGVKESTSKNIYQLIFDNEGYLWVGTERGVDKLELDKDTTIKDAFFFGRNDGFLGIETCLNAVDKDDNGHLWFGALYGLTEYQPSGLNKNSQMPIIYLEDVKVAFKSIDTINVSRRTNSDKVLRLNPEQRQISFSFKTVDLDHPNDVEYRYKLNDNAWSPWSTIATQDYSELNYGRHDFMAQSRNHRWLVSEPLQFSFFIESPLYMRAWFQWAVIGLVLLVIVIIAYQYIQRIKSKNLQDKERLELENHLLTLEQKALRLQMNPHFIFNVLNGIKAMAPTNPEKMNDTVNSFAILLRETLVNSRKDTIGLDQEIKTLRQYIEVERLMAAQPFDHDIKVETHLDPEEILIPPMLIQPFVENAIRHGILIGPRQGMLTIKFSTMGDELFISIIDNGIGIYRSQQQKPKTDHQSMALKVTTERLESISGKNSLQIEELKDMDGNIVGTSINFKVPLKTDY